MVVTIENLHFDFVCLMRDCKLENYFVRSFRQLNIQDKKAKIIIN